MTGARRTAFFTGELLDPEDFSVEQEAVRDRGGAIELEIGGNGTAELWTEVEDLALSGPEDRHFTLDRETGRVRFGDGTHGRRPEPGGQVTATYRRGAGGWLVIPLATAVAGFVLGLLRRRRRG
ncbi:MAG TPA: hypothetical protein VD704_01185 [Gaiellaceae bacterium]|nr:hypothetical protein [Gaiellaceae bacterium]